MNYENMLASEIWIACKSMVTLGGPDSRHKANLEAGPVYDRTSNGPLAPTRIRLNANMLVLGVKLMRVAMHQ
jgi:hypothetical protein